MSVAAIVPRTTHPTAELAVITPAMAEEWLGKNDRNRAVRQKRVETYTAAMLADDWIVTGEGIKFDWNGRMIDGQHRLHAIVASGVSCPTFVFHNLNPDTQLVLDTGSKRTQADALKMAGLVATHSIEIASAAGIGIRYAEGFYRKSGRSWGGREVTNTEVLNYVRQHPQIEDAAVVAANYRKPLHLPPSPLTFAVMTLTGIDADATQEFLLGLRNMTTDGPGDPLYTLLRRLKSINDDGEYLRPAQVLFLIFRTWNAWRAGERLLSLKTGGNGRGEIQVPEPK